MLTFNVNEREREMFTLWKGLQFFNSQSDRLLYNQLLWSMEVSLIRICLSVFQFGIRKGYGECIHIS